jgi:hypothetical protein
MTETRGDYRTRFKPIGNEALAEKPISVFLPKDLDTYVRSLPNRAEWLRAAIREAALRDTEHNL